MKACCVNMQSAASACLLDLRFAAGQLTWVSARSAAAAAAVPQLPKQEGAPPAAAPAAGQNSEPNAAAAAATAVDLGLPQLFADLAQRHAAVSLPAEAAAAAAAEGAAGGPVAAPTGVWVHGSATLQAVFAAVLAHLAQRLPS